MKRKELLSGAVVTVFVFTSAFIATKPMVANARMVGVMPMFTMSPISSPSLAPTPDPSLVAAGPTKKNTGGCSDPDANNNCTDEEACKSNYAPAGGVCSYYKTDDGGLYGCACTKKDSLASSSPVEPVSSPSEEPSNSGTPL